MSLHSSRSRSPDEKDSNSETERPRSPSPIPRIINEEWYRSAHAVFVKRWYRGHNTCSRCDFEYVPVRGQQSQRRLEDKAPKTSQLFQQQQHQRYHSQQQQQQPLSNKASPASGSLVKEIKEEKKPEIKREVPESPGPRKKPHYDTAPTSDAQITSSLMGGTALPPYILDHPAFRGYPMMHDPTPALRQLSEYAKPHIGGGGPNTDRTAVPGPGFDPFNRFPGLYQPSAKERLDAETEKRGERERSDPRNRDSWEAKDKVKSEMDFKPQDRTPSYPNAGMLDAHLLELQKRYGSTVPPGGAGGNLLPVNLSGVFPPAYLTAEWMRRERERLELLGAGGMINLSAVDASILSERLLAERFHAERLNERLMLPADPIYRLEMAGLGTASVSEQSHTTHTHSHTHLHLHQPDAAAAAAALYPPFHPLVASAPPHLMPTPGFALPAVGMNPLAGGNHSGPGVPPGSLPFGPPVPHPAYSFAASQQLMAAARDQDLYYRELLSRPPYSTDPILNQQLTAQAIAHQEAVQRQLAAVERDRLGASLHGAVLPR